MEVESQVVLYIARKHDFRDVFKTWQKCWEGYILVHLDGDYFEVDGDQ
jgi:hypothetical protein